MSEVSDQLLITRLQQGDDSALNILMGRYKRRLFSFIYRYIPNEETAYDVLQETFVKLYFNADKYNSNYRFSSWLYQIALNLCRDYARKHGHEPALSLDAELQKGESASYHDIIADDQPNAEEITNSRQELAKVQKEIQNLPHKLKTALILYAVEEHSQEQCAEILSITPKTVETRVYRARKILANKLLKLN